MIDWSLYLYSEWLWRLYYIYRVEAIAMISILAHSCNQVAGIQY